ncbi:MAG: zinc-binding dehydrogenase [Thermoprotei archaeon]|mgnify:CR=1 FL=1|nr:MAG: zinc-binding dehydrogenase [Thermoprotei archaeon]
MKAAVFYGPNQPLKVEEYPTPKVGPGEALVKVAACGVCHTDMHYLKGVPTFKKPPMILGHEISGTVAEVGEGVTAVKPGDRVLVPAILPCGRCYYCRIGRENICLNLLMVGNHVDGGYAEYIKVPAKDLIPLPSEIPLQEGAIIADAITSPYAAVVRRAELKPGETVAVWGATGGLGLNVVQIASALGGKVIALGRREENLKLAKELGAWETINLKEDKEPVRTVRRLTGGGADVAFDVTGVPQVIEQAFESIKQGGRFIVVGYSDKPITINAGRIMFRELEIRGVMGCRPIDYYGAIELVRSGKIRLLVSHKLPLEQINEAFKLLEEGKVTRAIVTP